MLMILVNWLYMAITTYLVGYALLGLFTHLFEYRIKHQISYIFAGLLGTTVYAQIYSLFGGVGLASNILLMIACLLIVLLKKNTLKQELMKLSCFQNNTGKRTISWGYTIAIVIVIILFAYGTSRGYMHFDTGLYHAQSIRWIEEYGVVPGLANLQSRYAYNSAAFSLTALYGMKWLFGQSLHATAGFFALISVMLAMDIKEIYGKNNRDRGMRLSDFVRLGLIFYLGVIFGEMMSPASDYYAQLLIFDILILWLEQDEMQRAENKRVQEPYCLLCILLVYAVTIKFSVGLLLLLVIKPAVMLIRKKAIKEIVICLLSGLFTALPFFVRNVIISGWMIYPSTAIDLFSVDWKLPKGQADLDALEIGAYGKGLNDVAKWDTPFSVWCPTWFAELKMLEKLFVLGTLMAIVILVIWIIVTVIKKSVDLDFMLVAMVFAVAAGFWFLSAPLIRYGYSYVITMPLLVFGYLVIALEKGMASRWHIDKVLNKGFQIVVALFLLSRIPGLYEDIETTVMQPYYVAQRDYDIHEATTTKLGTITFYIPTEQGQIGYDKFPSSLFVYPVELRGDTLEEGFRQKN